ncbi:hypothetical protein QN277_010558 [Acacia crassicarpa]|uniref:Uncharacterized protein n=1 Tax=Acacia crassicarpa TaxID=499986 RepID=A0AAE1IQ36_9FABA|nr:hypothetical protein QN277_010558 [Acacia crassicarpa]
MIPREDPTPDHNEFRVSQCDNVLIKYQQHKKKVINVYCNTPNDSLFSGEDPRPNYFLSLGEDTSPNDNLPPEEDPSPNDDLPPEEDPGPNDNVFRSTRRNGVINFYCTMMKTIESLIRASYGIPIHMGTEEFARNMFLDACFLLELLLRLIEDPNIPSDLGYIDDDKKMSRLLTDLMLLENQVPFVLLKILSKNLLSKAKEQELASLVKLCQDGKLSAQKLESLFRCNVSMAVFPIDVCHFLHLIHLCFPDPYQHRDIVGHHPLQLRRCARKLQALGITIRARDYGANVNRTGPVASALSEFMDKFEFEIEFDELTRQLIIPTLHIKEATEVRWRNFIAWEQIGGLIGVGYKFTSYAYFFKGLVCSVHDVQLLREAEVIKTPKEAKDEDLLIMFQSIATGAEQMDGRYNREYEQLNEANVKGVARWCVLILRMAGHYWRCFQEWFQRESISMLRGFVRTYLGTHWKFIGVVSGLALLVLAVMQTIYAARSPH